MTKSTQNTTMRSSQKSKTTSSKMTKTAPVATTINSRTSRPTIKHLNGGNCRIIHREYISDYSAAKPDFSVTKLAINPGLNAVFPWLSGVASRYEYYTFKKLRFCYQPVCSTSTPGSVMLAADYDAADVAPSSKVVLMSFSGAVRTAPWQSVTYDSMSQDRTAFTAKRFVRQGGVGESDVKTYDVCNFYIASVLTPNAPTSLGELYVEYDVELITPQLLNSIAANRKSQTTYINVPDAQSIKINADIRGTDAEPLMWPIFSNSDKFTYVDLVFNGVGNYLLNMVRTRKGNLAPTLGAWSPPDIASLMLKSDNFAGSWGLDASSGLDFNFSALLTGTNTPYASYTALLGGGDVTNSPNTNNYSNFVTRFFYNTQSQPELQPGDFVSLTLTPIDASLASQIASTRTAFSTFGPDFGFPVLIPPKDFKSVTYDGVYQYSFDSPPILSPPVPTP